MIGWVLRALRRTQGLGRVLISVDDPEVLAGIAEVQALRSEDRLEILESGPTPSASVVDALVRRSPGEALLVTTADHPLITGAMIEHFWSQARAAVQADVVVGVVAAETVRELYPGARRTFIPLSDGWFTGANLFALRGGRASQAAEFWRKADHIRKRPWRLARLLGPTTLARFAVGRLDLSGAMRRVSRAMDAEVEAVVLPFPECALDVDRPADLELARRVLAARAAM